jgi:hypothetical protein
MNELRKYLWCDAELIGGGGQARDCCSGGRVVSMFLDLCGDKKSGVQSMNHRRPSNISPSKSSSEASG